MYSQSLIQLLIIAAISSKTAAVEQCRCASKTEGNLYARRRLTHELQTAHGFQSVKIDSVGYYIIDGSRVLPPIECEHHQTMQAQAAEDEAEARGFFSNLYVRVGLRGGAQQQEGFLCDTHTIRTPPTHSSMPLEVEKFLLHELIKDSYVLNEENILVKAAPMALSMYQDETNSFMVESDIDCARLPRSTWYNPRSIPFHCRCPTNVDSRTLPKECHDHTAY
jgi:hypothetical protein